ncbi:UDP-2,3-diacylglucosamine diphosphatase [Vibrio sp. SCSIO 43136]|uniref:UDP-2,3-diacylglucosamine diphosphatase n=1 Tax=Vibrio sp. SCSIO 43136 TaxID=2819101 RepID=UPI0020763053|nr:UDP-2,3-diacylglucosamine diphosphatase [Vibrio sp. SCSIO 43136]USD64344.1 UDP-2,3-diacylglucosamine diphosphatase [Vibrio sp. SCSIO 43136]
MSTLFIADLHLSPAQPELTQCFTDFIYREASQAKCLYVLGDLFDFWLGDDDNSDFANEIRQAFLHLTRQGIECYFVHGNRDFLVNKKFAKDTGVTLLGDEHKITLYGQEAVILHGDTLCIDDVQYQAFRAKVHQPWLQWVFNKIPMAIRKKIVKNIQGKARDTKQEKSQQIMDVTPDEVVKVMDKHQVNLMIHGHTHRPDRHILHTKQGESVRIVLPDWRDFGYALKVEPQGMTELKFPVKSTLG